MTINHAYIFIVINSIILKLFARLIIVYFVSLIR